jgi:hypothetical protein
MDLRHQRDGRATGGGTPDRTAARLHCKTRNFGAERRNLAQQPARAEAMSPAFAELRTTQILAEIHFGRPAIGVLFRGRQQVFAAVTGRYGGAFSDFYFPDAQTAEQHREFEVSMQRLLAEHRAEDGTPDETDQLSQRIDAARTALEGARRPFLADPPWLKKLSNFSQKLGLG